MLCDAFGWDYNTFSKQPNWFIDMLVRKRHIDRKYADKKTN